MDERFTVLPPGLEQLLVRASDLGVTIDGVDVVTGELPTRTEAFVSTTDTQDHR